MEIYDFMVELNEVMRLGKGEAREAALIQLVTHPRYTRRQDESPESIKLRADKVKTEYLLMMTNPVDRQVFRFAKETTHLARTLLVVRTATKFQLNVEVMRKTAEHTQDIHPVTGRYKAEKNLDMKVATGAEKRAKESRSIDESLKKRDSINLTIKKVAGYLDMEEILKEVRMSQEFSGLDGSENIAEMRVSKPFRKGKMDKVVIVSEKGIPLSDMIEKGGFKHFSVAVMNDMIAGLLRGAKLFNTKYVHQDLKPDNILVLGDSEKGYRLALTDFGLAQPLECVLKPRCTAGYQSPEMSACADFYEPDNEYYDDAYRATTGYRLSTIMRKEKVADEEGGSLSPSKIQADPSLWRPHPKNDSWAMGIVLFELIYGCYPETKEHWSYVQANPLLKALLEVEREKRVTIGEALDIHLAQSLAAKEAAPQQAKADLDPDSQSIRSKI